MASVRAAFKILNPLTSSRTRTDNVTGRTVHTWILAWIAVIRRPDATVHGTPQIDEGSDRADA